MMMPINAAARIDYDRLVSMSRRRHARNAEMVSTLDDVAASRQRRDGVSPRLRKHGMMKSGALHIPSSAACRVDIELAIVADFLGRLSSRFQINYRLGGYDVVQAATKFSSPLVIGTSIWRLISGDDF